MNYDIRKILGSVCHIICLLAIIFTGFLLLKFFANLSIIHSWSTCEHGCILGAVDPRPMFYNAFILGLVALFFYILGVKLKKKPIDHSGALQKSTKQVLLQVSGWVGIALIIAAYFLLSFSFLSPDSLLYQGMNILGSVGIAFEAFSKKDYQPVVLQIVWILIATMAIIKIVL